MAHRVEDLNDNPLFQFFLSSQHYANAARENYLILVPTTPSITLIKPNKDFLETHILKKSPYYQDQYVTLNGKSVVLADSQLTCKLGFAKPRTVAVTSEELYYDDNYSSFSVLRINFPLEGMIPAAYYKSITEATTSADGSDFYKRSIDEWEAVICRYTSDSTSLPIPGGILIGCARFVSQFNQSYVLVKGFIDHAGSKVTDACARLLTDALTRAKVTHREYAATRQCANELCHAIESMCYNGIHKKLFAGLAELYAREEEMTQHRIASLRSLSQLQLGVRAEVQCKPVAATKALSQLGSYTTPLSKLGQLAEVAKLIQAAVGEQTLQSNQDSLDEYGGETDNVKRDNVLTAEDMIPLTVYVLLQSGVPHIHAHLQYLHYFHPNKQYANVESLDVHAANFQAAVQLIDSGKLGLDIHAKESIDTHQRSQPSSSSTSSTSPSSSTTTINTASATLNGAIASLSVSVVPRTVSTRHARALSNSSSSPSIAQLNSGLAKSGTQGISGAPPSSSPPSRGSLWTDEELQITPTQLNSTNSLNSSNLPSGRPRVEDDSETNSRRSRHASTRSRATAPAGTQSSRWQSPLSPSAYSNSRQSVTASNPALSSALSAYYSVSGSDNQLSARNNSGDDRHVDKSGLGEFLSKLKNSDDVITGNVRSLK